MQIVGFRRKGGAAAGGQQNPLARHFLLSYRARFVRSLGREGRCALLPGVVVLKQGSGAESI
jgi:hypothetical protein